MAKKVIQINKNPVYDFGMVATVFGEETDFTGDLQYKKSLQINGRFEGEITSSGYLVIGEKAVVKANIRAKHVYLHGTVYGNIEALAFIEIHPNAKLYGNIRTARLKIGDGVVFEGKCEMIKPEEKKHKKDSDEKDDKDEKNEVNPQEQ